MTDQEIRTAQEDLASAFRSDPDTAFSTIGAEASISDGLACRVTDGTNVTQVDMPVGFGGTATGPSPGFHARAAVASCTAIGIKSAAARAGLALEQVSVRVEMNFDDGAIFGMGSNTAAPMSTKLLIRVKSDCSDEELNTLVTEALEADPYFLALRDPQTVTSEIEII
jgi:uncharacterized OsmC-like protein